MIMTILIRDILQDLERTRENMLALSDDIWLSIDHNDEESMREGVAFKTEYNDRMKSFDRLAKEISELVQQYTQVRMDEVEPEIAAESESERNARVVRELNREEAHGLNEDFTFKRPFGFILDGHATSGVTTWQRLYELVCRHLLDRDEGRFRALHDHPDFISSRGHHNVTSDPNSLRKAMKLADGLFVESNLSANSIRDVIARLLNAYEIPTESMKVFLREDRDAEESN